MSDQIWQHIIESGALDCRTVHYFLETPSTNDVAMQIGKEGAAAGTIVLAESQSKGRGRLGRKWQSPSGTGLYFSLILRPQIAPEDLAKITLAAGVSVCQAIEAETKLNPQIKWPNDILIQGRKVGGILTETGSFRAGEIPLVVLGIGLNVSTPTDAFPEELRDKCASLSAYAIRPINRGPLLNEIVARVDDNLALLCAGNFAHILAQLRKRDATMGKKLTWLTTNNQIITGASMGIDDHGLLHIQDDQGKVHEVLSGDVSLST